MRNFVTKNMRHFREKLLNFLNTKIGNFPHEKKRNFCISCFFRKKFRGTIFPFRWKLYVSLFHCSLNLTCAI